MRSVGIAIVLALFIALLSFGGGYWYATGEINIGAMRVDTITVTIPELVFVADTTRPPTELVTITRDNYVRDTVYLDTQDADLMMAKRRIDSTLAALRDNGVRWIVSDTLTTAEMDSVFVAFSMTEKQFLPARLLIAERLREIEYRQFNVPMFGDGEPVPFYDDKNFRLSIGLLAGAVIGYAVVK